MSALALLLGAMGVARAAPVAVVVGASDWWIDGCVPRADDPGSCRDPDRALHFADDDAWRVAYLLRTIVAAADIRVLTTPDESTRGREFPGGAPSPATAENLIAAVAELAPRAEGADIFVYIAAHGTPDAVMLADGAHPFAEIRRRLREAVGERGQLVLVSDACLSARWRTGDGWILDGGGPTRFPAVEPSATRDIEAAVNSVTPEDPRIAGGVFSYLVFSGLLGAADTDRNDVIGVQELSDFVHAYASGLPTPLVPVVRSPGGDVAQALPRPTLGGRLTVGGRGPSRWIVALPGGPVLAEAFTPAGETRTLALPAAHYLVLEMAYAGDASGAFHLAGETGLRHEVDVAEGARVGVPTAGTPFPTALFRGDGSAAPLEAGLTPPPVGTVAEAPHDAGHIRAATRGWLGAGVRGGVGDLVESGPYGGGVLRWAGPAPAERLWHGWVEIAGAVETGSPRPSSGTEASLLGGVDLPLRDAATLGAGATLGLGVLGVRWTNEELSLGTLGPAARAGAWATWWPRPGRVGVRLTGAWEPALLLVDEETDEAGGHRVEMAPDLDRLTASMLVEVRQ